MSIHTDEGGNTLPDINLPPSPRSASEAQPREALEALESVLCDPEGRACIHGSAGDLKVIDDALNTLRSALPDSRPQAAPAPQPSGEGPWEPETATGEWLAYFITNLAKEPMFSGANRRVMEVIASRLRATRPKSSGAETTGGREWWIAERPGNSIAWRVDPEDDPKAHSQYLRVREVGPVLPGPTAEAVEWLRLARDGCLYGNDSQKHARSLLSYISGRGKTAQAIETARLLAEQAKIDTRGGRV